MAVVPPGNQLTGKLDPLARLPGLVYLDGSSNQRTWSAFLVHKLAVMRLPQQGSAPAVTGALGAWLPALTSLEYLDVAMNQLTSTIPPLSGLASLRTFSVALNQLTGTLPSDFLALPNIREFDASSNRQGRPAGVGSRGRCRAQASVPWHSQCSSVAG